MLCSVSVLHHSSYTWNVTFRTWHAYLSSLTAAAHARFASRPATSAKSGEDLVLMKMHCSPSSSRILSEVVSLLLGCRELLVLGDSTPSPSPPIYVYAGHCEVSILQYHWQGFACTLYCYVVGFCSPLLELAVLGISSVIMGTCDVKEAERVWGVGSFRVQS